MAIFDNMTIMFVHNKKTYKSRPNQEGDTCDNCIFGFDSEDCNELRTIGVCNAFGVHFVEVVKVSQFLSSEAKLGRKVARYMKNIDTKIGGK